MWLDMLDSFVANISPVSTSIIVGTIIMLFWIWWKKPHSNFPPGPRGIPFLGVLPFLGGYTHEVLTLWSRKYGPIFSARFGMKDVVVINSYKAFKEAFVGQGTSFAGRPWIHLLNRVDFKRGLSSRDYTEDFKAQKQFGLQTLNRLGSFHMGLRKIIEDEMDILVEHLKTKMNQPLDLRVVLNNFSSNMVARLAFGRRFNYEGDKTLSQIFSDISNLAANYNSYESVLLNMLNLFESLKYFPPFKKLDERTIQTFRNLKVIAQKEVEEHKRKFNPDEIKDFVDAFLLKMRETGVHESFQEEQLVYFVKDLILAGADSLSAGLSWPIVAILKYPQYKDIIYEEIDKTMGKNGPPPHTMQEMPHTYAFLQEVMRHCPPAPLGVRHETICDTVIGGYNIPAGTTVIANLWGINHDPDSWEEPHNFDPYRHLEDGKFVLTKKSVSFSAGPRFCLGENLAKREIFTMFTKLLQAFNIESATTDVPSLDRGISFAVHHPFSYLVVLRER